MSSAFVPRPPFCGVRKILKLYYASCSDNRLLSGERLEDDKTEITQLLHGVLRSLPQLYSLGLHVHVDSSYGQLTRV